jgi:hypothetical protein
MNKTTNFDKSNVLFSLNGQGGIENDKLFLKK